MAYLVHPEQHQQLKWIEGPTVQRRCARVMPSTTNGGETTSPVSATRG